MIKSKLVILIAAVFFLIIVVGTIGIYSQTNRTQANRTQNTPTPVATVSDPIEIKRDFTAAAWVHRYQIASPKKIDELLRFIKKSDIRTLFVQVRGRGDAYYDSKYEHLAYGVKKGFDPLKYLLRKTRNTDIAVHAWVNMFYCLDIDKFPPAEYHVVARHPEWLTVDHTGRCISSYSQEEMKTNRVEGIFKDPGVPAVREYIVKIVADILDKYKVKGIHLDYVRYPYSGHFVFRQTHLSDFGYNKISNEIFSRRHNIDPFTIDRSKTSRSKTLFDNYRRDNVTTLVRQIHETVKAKDKDLILSAAVMARHHMGRVVYFQDWNHWLNEGILDLACVMSYSRSVEQFQQLANYSNQLNKHDRILLGMYIREQVPLPVIVEQIRIAYNMGFKGFCFFSFMHDEQSILGINKSLIYDDVKLRY
jgi:uncharacterized lipoprotein YddW (UPF0748 family)